MTDVVQLRGADEGLERSTSRSLTGDPNADVTESFEGSGPTRKVSQKFEQLCQEIVGGSTAYASYRAAPSQVSHASVSVADLCVDDRDVADVGEMPFIFFAAPIEYSPDIWLGTALLMTMRSRSAWSRIDATHHDEEWMRSLHAQMGTDFEAHFTQKGIDNQAKRKQEHQDWLGAK